MGYNGSPSLQQPDGSTVQTEVESTLGLRGGLIRFLYGLVVFPLLAAATGTWWKGQGRSGRVTAIRAWRLCARCLMRSFRGCWGLGAGPYKWWYKQGGN